MIGEYCGFCYIERNDVIDYAVKNVGLFKTGVELEAKWLYYYLNSQAGKQYLKQIRLGSSQPYLSLGGLRSLPILNCDAHLKKSIVKILSSLDSKIELNNRINTELEAMAKTIYDYWFVQFDFPTPTPSGRAGVGLPYKSSGGKMVWCGEFRREIPEGWGKGTIDDIAELVRGVSYSKENIMSKNEDAAIPILRATNLTNNIIDLNNMVYIPESFVSEKQVLNLFDILMTMSSGSINHIGKNGFYYFNEKVSFGTFCAKLVAKKNYRYYLYSYMQSPFLASTIKNECLGTNINNLNGSLVTGFNLVIPCNKVVEDFNKKVSGFFDLISTNIRQNLQLSNLRDWLLPMLMNGQVSVGNAYEQVEEVLGMVAEGGEGYKK